MIRDYLLLSLLAVCGAAVKISVASEGGNATSNLQYGIMEEEINHCGDGGLYAELIRNRAFQGSTMYPANLDGWAPVDDSLLALSTPSVPLSAALPTSVNVKGSKGTVGLTNVGWWGIEVKEQKYTGSFYVKGAYKGVFTASLQSNTTGKVLAKTKIKSKSVGDAWTQHTFTLKPKAAAPDAKNTFSLTFHAGVTDDGSLDFNLISLFPPTWNDRPNGLRIDLMQAMKDFGPKFLRFPGGSDLEGSTLEDRWKWNETIGPLTDRPGRATAWGYQQTSGIGLVEYMEWCDDLELEPILAVWAGLTLDKHVIPEAELGPYIDDALNELEFLMGDADTEFGALRASLGYPKPWKLRYVEIGNEDNLNDGLESYIEYRFQAFYDAIKAKYPDMIILASTVDMELTGDAGGDYHLYDTPDNLTVRFNFFDQYSPKNPILLGEIAATEFNNGKGIDWDDKNFALYPWWIATVSEAVFLLGAERNADKIIGTTYAPFFMNLNDWEWSPTFISFNADSAQTALSTSWHLYKLFSESHITNTLPTTSETEFGPLYYVAGLDSATESHIFKAAVYNSTEPVPVSLTFEGVKAGSPAELTVLTAPDAFAMNEVGAPNLVDSKVKTVKAGKGGAFEFELPDLSIAVLKTT
ncbi:glycoside hydrolase [Aspergillus campestris IBT 28561]|uniref:non-reducing end alpha-L-arabinofuranosidase n=1 Tax=Aspergillus campestris (strain IBT 28561) TaxID=1392248 RepID=A0A2I1DB73_ASPC2|nr:glycoside hydrolase [Aspergillus campestris IBT 28561]PKY07122.1 glycoside hydrolase [Aspergillus campestris IBT 28561]